MTDSLAALPELDAVAALLRGRSQLPPRSATLEQSERLFPAQAAEPLPARDVLEALREELRRACEAGRLDELPHSVLRRAALVLWDGERQAAAFPGLLDIFLAECERKPRWLRGLIEAWLREFRPDRFRLPEAGRRAAGILPHSSDPRLSLWNGAERRYAMFDAAQGPRKVGVALLAGPGGVGQVLAETGMDDPLRANGGFFRAAMLELLGALPAALRGPDSRQAWERAAALLEVSQVRRDRAGREVTISELRAPDMATAVIDGCLSAWCGGAPAAGAPWEEVKAFLIRTISDPRVRPEGWRGAREDCVALMRRWLAAQSLEAFFDLISEMSNDRQWRYRRAFWRACIKKMPADKHAEVWVVFGQGMATRARTIRELSHGYGQVLSKTYVNQAILIIRLGNIVLTEWSNMGPIRAWRIGDRACPPLYREDYNAAVLRGPSLDFPDHPTRGKGGSHAGNGLTHAHSDTYLWQGCAADFLRIHVGLTLTRTDYEVR